MSHCRGKPFPWQCPECGEMVFDNDADEQIAQALRDQFGLLSADQIRNSREELGLSQRSLAEHLGVAPETISRWEHGALTQTRAMDRYLRVYFSVPAARAALVNPSVVPTGSTKPNEGQLVWLQPPDRVRLRSLGW